MSSQPARALVDDSADAVADVRPLSRPNSTYRAVGALAAGVGAGVVAGVALVLLSSPWVSSILALSLVLLAPTSSRLDRRITLNIALVAGFAPLALLSPSLLGPRSASITMLSVACGAVAAAWWAGSTGVVPTWRPRDALILVASALAALITLPLRSPGTPDRALAMLSTGIDNSYHFSMYLEQRLTASGSTLVAANADASGFGFSDYPQWFHKGATVLAQLVFGEPAAAPQELLRYAQLQWLVFIAVAAMMTAAVLQSLPDRTPASLLVPALAVTWSLVLGVPGALNLIQGHLSFLLAACAPVVIFLLARSRRLDAAAFVAMCGLVFVTASWLLLLPLAGAAFVPPLVAMWFRQGALVRWVTFAFAASGAAVAFTLFVLPWLFGAGLQAVVRDGTVPRVGLPTMSPLLIGALVLLVVLRHRHPGTGLGAHVLVAGVAVGQQAVLGCYMLMTTGELTYYFWKLGLGSLLASIIVTTHALVAVRVTQAQLQGRSADVRPFVAALLTVAAVGLGSALQEFTAPSAMWAAILPTSLSTRATSLEAGDVATVLSLADSTPPHDAARTRFLATRPDDMNAAHASEWFHALSHSATRNAVSVDDPVYRLAKDRGNLALASDIASTTLRIPGRRVVVTDPGLYRSIVASVTPAEAERVTLLSEKPAEESP